MVSLVSECLFLAPRPFHKCSSGNTYRMNTDDYSLTSHHSCSCKKLSYYNNSLTNCQLLVWTYINFTIYTRSNNASNNNSDLFITGKVCLWFLSVNLVPRGLPPIHRQQTTICKWPPMQPLLPPKVSVQEAIAIEYLFSRRSGYKARCCQT